MRRWGRGEGKRWKEGRGARAGLEGAGGEKRARRRDRKKKPGRWSSREKDAEKKAGTFTRSFSLSGRRPLFCLLRSRLHKNARARGLDARPRPEQTGTSQPGPHEKKLRIVSPSPASTPSSPPSSGVYWWLVKKTGRGGRGCKQRGKSGEKGGAASSVGAGRRGGYSRRAGRGGRTVCVRALVHAARGKAARAKHERFTPSPTARSGEPRANLPNLSPMGRMGRRRKTRGDKKKGKRASSKKRCEQAAAG